MRVPEVAIGRAADGLISGAVAAAAALWAFQSSARAHLLDTLLNAPRCGNPLQDVAPTWVDHCAPCWAAGGLAGLLALAAMAAIPRGLRRIP